MAEHVAQVGLTPTQFMVLEMLLHKGTSGMGDIIKLTYSSSGNIGLVVDNLIKSGLVEKQVAPDDQRARLISLTETGKQKISDYYPCHLEFLKRKFSTIDAEEKEVLVSLLNRLRYGLSGKVQ